MTGRDLLLEVLTSEGVEHVFGNPGSTELPFMDALASADLHYVLALQEATAVGIAEGYAMATGRPAFLNLHTAAGLGNAIGNLTNAQANGTPLVVTAGQQDRRHLFREPLLSGDLVGIARSVSKWSQEAGGLHELGPLLRRAFRDAASPPAGPVFLSLPMDVLDEEGDVEAPPVSRIERAAVAGGLAELADLLVASPERLAIVAANEVATSGGVEALAAVAETLGAPVFGAPLYGLTVFPTAHPLWCGSLPFSAAEVREALAPFERVLLIGKRGLLAYPYTPGAPIPPGTELIHLSADAAQLGRADPVRLGLAGNVRATLEAVLPLLRGRVDPAAAAERVDVIAAREAARLARIEGRARDAWDVVPMAPVAAVRAALAGAPPEIVVADESITCNAYVRAFHRVRRPQRFFSQRGGGLGWGMPAAVGVSLGLGREPVLCLVGDGSVMYSPQALWTAARERLPVVYVILNNRQYLILKGLLRARGGATARTGRFVAMDLVDPPVDFGLLARSMGVPYTLAERAGEASEAVEAALAAGGPHVVELPIAAPEDPPR